MAGPKIRGTITLKQGEFAMLGELHEHAVRMAEEEFAKSVASRHPPWQCPFLWLIRTPRVLLTIETPFDSDDEKVRSFQMMRTYMQMANARSYSFIHEAWMASFTTANMPKKMPDSVSGLPADQREDVLLITTFDHDRHLWTRYGVKHASTPKARLLARDDVDHKDVDHFEGRLFNLLKPEKPFSHRPGDDLAGGDQVGPFGDAAEYAVICPHCGVQHDMASVLDNQKSIPVEGDVMLCVACGQWSKAASEASGGARKLTEAESFVLGFDPRLRDVRRAWMEARADLASKKASKES